MSETPKDCTVAQESKVTHGSRELFLKAVSVWINKPHVVNRRLCGSTVHNVCRYQTKPEAEQAVVDANKLFDEINRRSLLGSLDSGLGSMESDPASLSTTQESGQTFEDLSAEKSPFCVIYRELVPKSEFFPRLYETIVYDKEQASVTFYPVSDSSGADVAGILPTKEVRYTISFKEIADDMPVWAQVNEITIAWDCDHPEADTPRRQLRPEWLRSTLLDKLVNWSQVNDITTSATSLMLVRVDKYKDMYVHLKNSYGRELVKNWTERTDPKKFVYEDIAIAAYLLLIWKEDRENKGLTHKQSFVDLGCGNGLLVYILTKEGHKGLGIDLRKRKIWDMFGDDVDLREQAIKPSSKHLFPDYDWLIGNHSDELTPWIPVIAARSSPTCSFFVLPCCHHDFVGKFKDSKKGQSKYGTYVDYVKEIVEHCGFQPEIDSLRIPSTKRICLMGRTRTYKPEDKTQADVRRQAFIDKRTLVTRVKRHLQMETEPLKPKITPVGVSESPELISDKVSNHNLKQMGLLLRQSEKVYPMYKRFNSTGSSTSGLGSMESDPFPTPTTPDIAPPPHLVSFILGKRSQHGTENAKRSEPSRLADNPGTVDPAYTDDNLHVRKAIRTQALTDTNKESTNSKQDIGSATVQPVGEGEGKWAQEFQPRVEPGVRNCQTVPEEIKAKIVNSVFDFVLQSDESRDTVETATGKLWRKGGSASLPDVAALFDKLTLAQLKAECGGLQTLLRNHSHIFQVSGGRVMLRDFSQADPWKGCNPHKRRANKARAEQRDTRKTTLCWFYERHPDGCPRSDSDCSFAHGLGELREKSLAAGQA